MSKNREEIHSKLMGLLQRAPYIRCEDVHRQYVVNWLMNEGVTVQEWISVNDRLPEHSDGHVLVTDGDRVKISCRNACYNTAMGETRCAQGYGAGMSVTHWMPLPEPPKEE